MMEKNEAEEILEDNNALFADVVNGFLFHGRQVVSARELKKINAEYSCVINGRTRRLACGAVKSWRNAGLRIVCTGLADKSDEVSDVPLTVFSFDGADYRKQFFDDGGTVFPFVTLVLYFGDDASLTDHLFLKDRLTMPEELAPYVSEYKINVFPVASLTREQLSAFKGDFMTVADAFVQKGDAAGDGCWYKPDPHPLKHVAATLGMLNALADDGKGEELKRMENTMPAEKKYTAFDAFDRVEKRGIKQGEDNVLSLMKSLFEQNRLEDARRAVEDADFRRELMQQLAAG